MVLVAFGSTHCSAFQRSSYQAELFCALAIRDLTRICHGQQHRACWFPLSICQKPSTLTNPLWSMDQSFKSRLCSGADSVFKKSGTVDIPKQPCTWKDGQKVGCCKLLAHWLPAWWAPCPRQTASHRSICDYFCAFWSWLVGTQVWYYFRMPWQKAALRNRSFRVAHLQPPQSPVVNLAPPTGPNIGPASWISKISRKHLNKTCRK